MYQPTAQAQTDQPVAEVPQVTQEMLAAKAKLKAKRQAHRTRQAARKAKRQANRESYHKGSTLSAMNSNVTPAEQRRRLLNRKRNCHLWAKRQTANEPPKAEAEMSTEAQLAAVPSPKCPAPQTRRAHENRIHKRGDVQHRKLRGLTEEEYIPKLMVQISGACLRHSRKVVVYQLIC